MPGGKLLVWVAVVFGAATSALVAKEKDVLPECVNIISINSPNSKRVRTLDNYGILADTYKAFLSKKPGKFRLKKGGFLGIKGTVALESLEKPGYYLRHKNYKFHLEKASKKSMFGKDATFYLLKVQDNPALYAFELYNHPSWFVAHKPKKPFKLTLRHVTGVDQKVIESTFNLLPLQCQKYHPGKEKQGKDQKKTSILDSADDDDNDLINIDDTDTTASFSQPQSPQSGVIEVHHDSADSVKDQDIITEVETAFNSSKGKNDQELNELETDIERKVDGLASKLITIKTKKLLKQKQLKDSQQQNEDDMNNGRNPPQTLAAFTDSSQSSGTEPADDVIIHVDDSSSSKELNKQGNKQSSPIKEQLEDTPKSESSVIKGEPKYFDVVTSEKSDSTNGIVKGTPKLMNEHLEVISRNALAKPDVNAQKRQETMPLKTLQRHLHGNKRTGFAKAVELVSAAESKLKNVLSKLEDKSSAEKADNAPGRRNKDEIKHDRVGAVLAKIHSRVVQEAARSRQLNDSSSNIRIPAQDSPAKVYFTENCEDAFPEACEKWAQKRYCLTFNELMKRYCRKACSLCDHVITTGFTPCDKTCGGGVRLRMLKVNNRQVLQRRVCNINKCPIDGGYTPYSNFSECSSTCGKGMMYRHRTCTSPPPQYGGRDCTRLGVPVDTKPCHVKCKDEPMVMDDNNENSNTADTGSGAEQDETVSAYNGPTNKKEGDDFEHMPEYQMEDLNAAPGYTVQTVEDQRKMEENALKEIQNKSFKWPSKEDRKSPMILHQTKGDYYEHRDHHGNRHLLYISRHKHHHPHFRTVHYNKKPVAKLKCGPSMFLKYHRREYNYPEEGLNEGQGAFNVGNIPGMSYGGQGLYQGDFKRTSKGSNKKRGLDFQNYKVYEGGKFMYDKYGMPMDTTKEVIKAFDSPYKIVLTKNKKHQMVISEECLESDSGVNPDVDVKADSLRDLESYVGPNGLSGTIKIASHTLKPKASSLAANGFYEYKYGNPGQTAGYTVQAQQTQEQQQGNLIGKELKQALDKAATEETRAITKSSLMTGAKATLTEELAADNEEALKEKKFEAKQRKNSMTGYARPYVV